MHSYQKTVQAGYFNLDAAQRQFGLQQQKSQNEINRYDLNIDKLNLQKGSLWSADSVRSKISLMLKKHTLLLRKTSNQTRF